VKSSRIWMSSFLSFDITPVRAISRSHIFKRTVYTACKQQLAENHHNTLPGESNIQAYDESE
jgi:hypothetical protein